MRNHIVYQKIGNNNNQQNLGIQVLRTILSFWIVCFHCLKTDNKILITIIFKRPFHAPTFMLISFYFLLKNLQAKNIIKIKGRIERLLIPYFVWPTFFWILSNISYFFFKNNRYNKFLSLYDLICQFIIGRNILGVFWFQFTLIFLTIFFFIICFTIKSNFIFLLQLFCALSYLLQYSNFNYNFFYKYNQIIILSIGYLAEIFPLAVTGLTLSSFNIIEKIKVKRNKAIFFSIIILYFLFKYEIFAYLNGFTYRGILFNFGATFLFIFFSLLPIYKIKYNFIIIFIKIFTNFTQGVYCLHGFVKYYLQMKISFVQQKKIQGCILIYLTSYLISFIGYKLFKSTKIKYLFN